MSVQTSLRRRGAALSFPSDSVIVLALFFLAVAAYYFLARLRVGPIVGPDEFLYGNLAQSVAAGDGLTWRGAPQGMNSVYPYVIAPAWMLADGISALRLAQLVGVLAGCSVVYPLWRAARTTVPARVALIAPALALLGLWMELTSKVMTEALAMPAATWALCGTILALQRPRSRWFVVAIVATAIAVASRAQIGVLVPILALAYALNVVRQPVGERRATARAFRHELSVTWSLVLLGLIALLPPGRDLLGSYASVLDSRPEVIQAFYWAGDHLAETLFMVGIVPLLATFTLVATPAAWRRDETGFFLCVFTPATILSLAVAGWFVAGVSPRIIERYVAYLGPVTLVGFVAALRIIQWRRAAVVTAVLASAVVVIHDLVVHPATFAGLS